MIANLQVMKVPSSVLFQSKSNGGKKKKNQNQNWYVPCHACDRLSPRLNCR